MLTSARKTMPALDYVSIIRSVYSERGAMLLGAISSAAVAAISSFQAEAPILLVVAAALLVVGLIRFYNMQAFWRAGIGDDDAEAAERWENRALIGGALVAFTHGIWCLVAILVVRDPFAELASCTLTIASTVGLVARNFGLDRLLTIQIVSLSVPLWIAMIFRGNFYHQLLAAMLILLLISYRKMAGDVRALLLSAVHGRVEVSRLAAEFDIAITTLEHGLCMLDENGTITLANDRAVQIFTSLEIGKLAGQPFGPVLETLGARALVPKIAVARLRKIIDERGSGKVLFSIHEGPCFEVTVSSGQQRTVLLFEDITERMLAEERINFIARHDTLTGLPNRSHFNTLAAEHLQMRAEMGLPSTLMIIDIDEFKHVNDSFGHVVGDELLRQTADRLSAALPDEVLLARLGGDEFIALCAADHAKGRSAAEQALAAFDTSFMLNGIDLPVRISIGVVHSPASQDDLEELMTKADLALNAAKTEGKARSQIFHAQMDIDYHYRQRLKADLRDAVAAGQLSLAFQPLLDISTRKVMSCEALARWTHAELGPIAPAIFIPLAEEMGLISDITAWVVENATRECSCWASSVGVGVNVSARDFRGIDLPALVDRALRQSGLPPERFEIEVTETAVIEERDLAGSVLQALADRGIAIALDDFGTGYSSLSYLSALPFTKLKIDRSFVADIADDPRALRLLANVARLGRDLDLKVVAEGVETEEQLNVMLSQTSVQQVQGYFFSRPLPAKDIAELIERFNGKTSNRHAENRLHG
ncbi:EAL domain-containing protein [Devosia sp. YIM 151766]|uniref:putative bifunctional diguanylate cyclase/phosphodiesterase n=1 Tax=Devosia sp. YIM 151766 TaxID=3017325 RepID=UPI00255D14E6|nr:EAL domain-containing protein [Devosia sp. YIM 151766]WIY52770.1 EAL domain-containing protein [Devosia sp. YIM 151766]